MGGFRFFCDLFLVHFIAVVLAQSSRNDKWHFDRRTRRLSTTVNKNTCTAKKLLQEYFPHAAAIQLKTSHRSENGTFHVGERAEFFCKDGYRQIGELKSFICQDNGTWKPYSMDQTGVCVIKQCNSAKFSCKDGKTIIDACKQCDCIGHCPDLSDEASCAPIVIDVTGKATGIFLGFNLGKRHAGPACSFTYFLNCITRRPIPPYLSALSLSEDPEHRRLTEDVEMSFIGEEIVRETPSI